MRGQLVRYPLSGTNPLLVTTSAAFFEVSPITYRVVLLIIHHTSTLRAAKRYQPQRNHPNKQLHLASFIDPDYPRAQELSTFHTTLRQSLHLS